MSWSFTHTYKYHKSSPSKLYKIRLIRGIAPHKKLVFPLLQQDNKVFVSLPSNCQGIKICLLTVLFKGLFVSEKFFASFAVNQNKTKPEIAIGKKRVQISVWIDTYLRYLSLFLTNPTKLARFLTRLSYHSGMPCNPKLSDPDNNLSINI